MSIETLRLSASTPRVTRSPIPERGQAVLMSGDLFADGRQRIVVGYDVTPEDAQELGRILDDRDEAQERLAVYIEKINALMTGLLRIANRPGGINEQLRAAMDARDHPDGSTT